ncbi:vWA domain-containing protein [Tropicimonas sp.]|uniref:vWA domain-containing protein n=1 Tax=Tropicimonas sp. TaxID=2067044 RepID=UPI003A83E083
MTDDLDRLRAALGTAAPAPDSARKAADVRAAMSAFDAENARRPQESAAPARPSSSRGIGVRLLTGGKSMIHALTGRAALTATTGLVAAGLAVFVLLPPEAPRAPEPVATIAEPAAAPLAAPAPSARAASNRPADAGAPLIREPGPAATLRATGRVAADDAMAELADMAVEYEGEAPVVALVAPVPVVPMETERFANADPNPVKTVIDAPVSTFSVDVDTASWSIARASLMAGQLPPPDAVRIEELVNYFPYAYPLPEDGLPFRPAVTLGPTPWNPDTRILRIGLQGALPEAGALAPLNLVFLIDTSGSMQDADKLPLLKSSLGLLLAELGPEDRVAIVTYAGSAGEVLAPTPASDRAAILAALERLDAGGATAGQAGLDQAYAVAESMAGEGGVTRVLLATDGDFNLGPSDPQALKDYVARKRVGGTYLSVLGFGRGNLNDALMQALAQNGNGQAAYIDTLAEAQKVLVDQRAGTLQPIARDAKVQVEFNPAAVAEYRLIGYETRALSRQDFNNDGVDAGEIGAGHQVTALYEVTPAGSPAALTDPLRYQTAPAAGSGDAMDELAFLRLRYKAPGGGASRLIELPVPAAVSPPDVETRFATAIAGFGQLLRGSAYLGEWGYADAIALAEGARGDDRFGYRAEAVRLMRLASDLAR